MVQKNTTRQIVDLESLPVPNAENLVTFRTSVMLEFKVKVKPIVKLIKAAKTKAINTLEPFNKNNRTPPHISNLKRRS